MFESSDEALTRKTLNRKSTMDTMSTMSSSPKQSIMSSSPKQSNMDSSPKLNRSASSLILDNKLPEAEARKETEKRNTFNEHKLKAARSASIVAQKTMQIEDIQNAHWRFFQKKMDKLKINKAALERAVQVESWQKQEELMYMQHQQYRLIKKEKAEKVISTFESEADVWQFTSEALNNAVDMLCSALAQIDKTQGLQKCTNSPESMSAVTKIGQTDLESSQKNFRLFENSFETTKNMLQTVTEMAETMTDLATQHSIWINDKLNRNVNAVVRGEIVHMHEHEKAVKRMPSPALNYLGHEWHKVDPSADISPSAKAQGSDKTKLSNLTTDSGYLTIDVIDEGDERSEAGELSNNGTEDELENPYEARG